MLRASLLRPSVIRQFSSSSAKWTLIPRPPNDSSTNTETRTESPVPVSTSSEEHVHRSNYPTDNPLPTEPAPLSPYDLELVKQRIREWTGHAALSFRNRADDFTANTKTTLSQLGLELNRMTGYEAIEALKRNVVEQEDRIKATREAAREAKAAYDEAVAQRSLSQREVNDLLQRKSSWLDHDVSRFTTLVRQDHLFEQQETRAKATLDEMENAVEREFSELMRSILARYHEEQVWSDKIRSASTYGSLAVLGLNMLVFVMAIIVVEPWKRRRLAQTFEKKIEELSQENEARLDASMKEIGGQLAEQEQLISKFVETSQNLVAAAVAQPVVQEIIREVKAIPGGFEVGGTGLTAFQSRQRTLELSVVAASAFGAGIIGCLWLLGR
ncbi:Sensitive to high expression protein 9, mitochondrial [Hypsizygus marmoreus]|uniref:Sensitive to high expression protein 9, mitochondrial n=1 Tax=Hypsizygus marmoreus TaxID=39966 RepID=A0A369JB27_HYPMA|nr:Sensitive to high expression protein 9, mitochondrial [Hypsizygus marmoreus]